MNFSHEKLLNNIGMLSDQGLNIASLVLFGKKEMIDRYLPCAEIIFEWRQQPGKTAHDFRKNWREPFFRIYGDFFILRHLQKNKRGTLADFKDIFPELKAMDISNILRELRRDGKIRYVGSRGTGCWEIAKNT